MDRLRTEAEAMPLRKALIPALVLVLAALGARHATASGADARDQRRFEVSVVGPSGRPGHSFVVGQRLALYFRDRRVSHGTSYRACWGPHLGRFRRCWNRVSGSPHTPYGKIFPPAVKSVGYWTAKWWSYGRLVGTWTFYVRSRD
jgi:hypothetical protein